MTKRLFICILLVYGLSFLGTNVWAIDVGWMQKGVRVWYFGGVGTTMSSYAEEAYLFKAVDGDNVQVTKHSAINHWGTTNAIDTSTYSFLDKGPCWIHPQKLQNLVMGDNWMGFEITLVTRATYTYDMLPYHFLPAKALFDLKAQREVVKVNYMIADYSTGTAYFDADTGLLLQYSQLNGYVTVFFVLSEINYDFANQRAFAEDDGPHTGFKSFVSEASLGWSFGDGGGTVVIQSSVESRYGDTVEMWVSTSDSGNLGSYMPPYENYCFFGSIPVLRRMDMTEASNYPPEQWNEYGKYLWWWVPTGVLQNSSINVFGVPMTRTSTDPYTFTATEEPEGLFFSKLWFGNDGYMTAFSVKDSNTGLDIDPGQTAIYFENLTTVDGLDYYRNTMGIARPDTSPTVTTASPSATGPTTGTSGGNVTSDGGGTVTARGVCWSTSSNPTTADSKTVDGSGTGNFTSSLTGLNPNTTYLVRAYATNSAGTSYGSDLTFTTPNDANSKPSKSMPWMPLLLGDRVIDCRQRLLNGNSHSLENLSTVENVLENFIKIVLFKT